MEKNPAILILQDKTTFYGQAIGAIGCCTGEVCFNTSMTGYQEIVTDPSYSGQIVAMTYPEIGNYGINLDDVESSKIQVSGFIVKNCCNNPSNWRAQTKVSNLTGNGEILTFSEYLSQNSIPGIKKIDTRKLVRILRDKGAQPGILATGDWDEQELFIKVKALKSMAGQDLASKVSVQSSYDWNDKEHSIVFKESPLLTKDKPLIIALDFGVKNNILRKLTSLGAQIKVLPSTTSVQDILSFNPRGLFLSNGPGDPEPLDYAINTIKSLICKLPIFGICLGHQLLALALGAQTYKLKFGHRGANHPIKNLKTGEVAITSQNHGFAVSRESIDSKDVDITHINLNDNTVAGIQHKHFPVFSVQYHPEASPGPRDSDYLFHQFIENINKYKVK